MERSFTTAEPKALLDAVKMSTRRQKEISRVTISIKLIAWCVRAMYLTGRDLRRWLATRWEAFQAWLSFFKYKVVSEGRKTIEGAKVTTYSLNASDVEMWSLAHLVFFQFLGWLAGPFVISTWKFYKHIWFCLIYVAFCVRKHWVLIIFFICSNTKKITVFTGFEELNIFFSLWSCISNTEYFTMNKFIF